MRVRELQKHFESAILEDSFETPESLGVKSANSHSALFRMEVYRHAYRARIQESLADDFSELEGLLGVEVFARLTDSFIRTCRSRYWDLGELSGDFLNYLHGEGLLSPTFLEQAEIDLASARALIAPEPTKTGNEASSSSADKEWPVGLHPSVQFLRNRVIWRRNGEVHDSPLAPEEHELLFSLRRRQALQDVTATLSYLGFKEDRAKEFFSTWTARGVIIHAI